MRFGFGTGLIFGILVGYGGFFSRDKAENCTFDSGGADGNVEHFDDFFVGDFSDLRNGFADDFFGEH